MSWKWRRKQQQREEEQQRNLAFAERTREMAAEVIAKAEAMKLPHTWKDFEGIVGHQVVPTFDLASKEEMIEALRQQQEAIKVQLQQMIDDPQDVIPRANSRFEKVQGFFVHNDGAAIAIDVKQSVNDIGQHFKDIGAVGGFKVRYDGRTGVFVFDEELPEEAPPPIEVDEAPQRSVTYRVGKRAL